MVLGGYNTVGCVMANGQVGLSMFLAICKFIINSLQHKQYKYEGNMSMMQYCNINHPK